MLRQSFFVAFTFPSAPQPKTPILPNLRHHPSSFRLHPSLPSSFPSHRPRIRQYFTRKTSPREAAEAYSGGQRPRKRAGTLASEVLSRGGKTPIRPGRRRNRPPISNRRPGGRLWPILMFSPCRFLNPPHLGFRMALTLQASDGQTGAGSSAGNANSPQAAKVRLFKSRT